MKFIIQGTRLYSIVNNKCPRCNQGDFFYSHAYHIKQFGKKHICCTHCELKYEREPGFFYGSMYISYAFSVALFVAWWVAKTILFPEMQAGKMVVIMMILQLGLAPLNLYLSKLTWLNLFVKFQESYVNKSDIDHKNTKTTVVN